MAFFSFAVAPMVFGLVDRTVAGQVVAAVLPRYYVTGLALVGVALVACVALTLRGADGRVGHLVATVLCAAMLGMLVWASAVLLPQAEAARRARDDRAFVRAHRASVTLNGATMAAALALIVVLGVSGRARRGR
jgi:hypothetical protein